MSDEFYNVDTNSENSDYVIADNTKVETNDGHGFGYMFLDLALNLVFILFFVIIIRAYLISPFHVFGASMCSTLNFIDGDCVNSYGEYIIVNKAGYLPFVGEPEYNDIIVFHPPNDEDQFFIKRVIGKAGDEIVIRDGLVFRNGEELDEPYLNDENTGNTLVAGSRREAKFDVPNGRYFVMGDNRLHSTDSRICFGATQRGCTPQSLDSFLPLENIAGKAWVTLWPPSKIRILDGL